MKKISLLLTALLISVASLNSSTITVNWNGSGNYLTIQEGINAAGDGDTVLVADGTYTGGNNKNLTWDGSEKHITVKSENGAENCIIDCEENGRGFDLTNTNQNVNDIISGFSIKNGLAENGGAIKCVNSTLKINSCIFIDNTSVGTWNFAAGGAIYFELSCINIHICKFISNTSSNWYTTLGGAIYSYNSSGIVSNSLFAENSAFGVEFGARGGGLYSGYSNLELLNNTFVFNWVNSMFGGEGGAVYGFNSNLQTTNSIYWGNTGGFGIPDQINYDGGQIVAEYNDIENDGFPGTGNIDEDPLFADPESSDYHLTPNSPCIDAGTPDTTGLNLPLWDLDGNERIWDGDGDGIDIIDMGCYEYGAPSVGVADTPENQIEYKLFQNYPNPFSSSTTISFNIPINIHEKAQIRIYNAKGQLVRKYEVKSGKCGVNSVVWNGKDKNGNVVSNGIYLIRIENSKFNFVRKVLKLN